jgi:hypothetical protein
MVRNALWTLALASAVLASSAARAQESIPPGTLIDVSDATGVAAALQQLGYRAQVETDSAGDPVIRSAAEGRRFSVQFYGCVQGAACTALMFVVAIDVDRPADPAAVNAWNRDQILGKVYTDQEGDPFLEHYVPARGGIAHDSFEHTVSLWARQLGRFFDQFGR